MKNIFRSGFSALTLLAAFAAPTAHAECTELPSSINLDEIGKNLSKHPAPGAVWVQDRENPKNIGVKGTYSSRGDPVTTLGIVVRDQSGQILQPWPYPIGNGVAIGFTTDELTLTGPNGEKATWKNSGPRVGYGEVVNGTPVLKSLQLTRPITEGQVTITGSYRLYLVCQNAGGCTLENNAELYLNRPLDYVLSVTGGVDNERFDTKEGDIVCGARRITIESSCRITADPTEIWFRTAQPTGAVNTLIDRKKTNIAVRCSGQEGQKVHLLVVPSKTGRDDYTAALSHEDGSSFEGIGLVYRLADVNEAPALSCDGSNGMNRWGEALDMASKISDGESRGVLHWGLCRLASPTDTGRYRTTATVNFWID